MKRRKTDIQIIDAAIEQLSKRGGYDPGAYLKTKYGVQLHNPGPQVAACCAVGGVEQAIWKITGKDPVSLWGRITSPTSTQRSVYARIIRMLNSKAMELYGENTVEEVTFQGQARTTRPKVLNVFHAVRDDLAAKS